MKRVPGNRGLWYDDHGKGFMEVTVPGTNGRKRSRRLFSASSREEAKAIHTRYRLEVLGPVAVSAGATPAISEVQTFQGYTETNWPISRDPRRGRAISENTARVELSVLRSRVFPAIGALPLTSITAVQIEQFEAQLLNDGYKNPTVNQSARVAHKILRHAERYANYSIPALRCWPTRLAEEPVCQELTPTEVKAFLAAFDTGVIDGGAGGTKASAYLTSLFRHAKPLFVCAIHLGLARTDLLSLRWASVDFQANAVMIKRKKTGIAALIPMSRAARKALVTCRKRQVVSSEFCFLTPSGRPYSEVTFRRYFLQARHFAKINRPLRPNDLRHSFASLLRSKGVDLGIIQKAMGHSTARMTLRYARVDVDAMQAVADALNRL